MLKCRFERAVYTGQQHFEITLARNEKDVPVEVRMQRKQLVE